MSMRWHLYYVDFSKFSELSTWSDTDIHERVLSKQNNLAIDDPSSIETALHEMSKGQCIPEHASLYAYAFEFLCCYFGTRVEQEGIDECRWSWIDEVEVIEPLITSGPPIEFPLTENVLVGHLTSEGIAETIKQLSRYDTDEVIEPEQGESPDILEFRCLFVSWLKEIRSGEGIVSFLL